jgi:hypothetical protein
VVGSHTEDGILREPSDRMADESASTDRYEIHDSRGQVVANPKDLDEATRLFWVGFNSFKLVAVQPDGSRKTISEKVTGA